MDDNKPQNNQNKAIRKSKRKYIMMKFKNSREGIL
jgi:hypothetical protein